MKTGTIYLYAFPNGKNYVGQTWDFKHRCSQHKSDCKQNVHRNPIFQRCYDRYGLPIPEVLYRGIETQAELDRLESLCFDRFGSHRDTGGCNIKESGAKGRHSDVTKGKLRKKALERVKAGTHNFQGKNNPSHQRVADGTHNFQDPDIQKKSYAARQKNNRQRLRDGTHNFQGKNNPSHQRVADGTHQMLGGDIQRKAQNKLVENGTHNFQGTDKYARYANWVHRQKSKARRRELYRISAVLLFTKSLCEIYRTRQLTREGFFDKEIPDTSNAKQQTLF